MLFTTQLEEWVENYTHRLVRLAYTYVRDWAAAEDRVQDAFIKAYRRKDQYDGNRDPFPWLARIVINECKMSRRRSFREIVMDLLPERKSASSEQLFLQQTDSEEVYQHVLALPEPFRTPIILYYFEDLSVEQISHVVGRSSGTIKSRLARGRDRLRACLKEGSYGETVERCQTTI